MGEPATMQKQIKTELSNRQVTLSAGQAMATFDATVYNDSDRFASFQLKLLAAGALPDANKPWYRLTPSVSSKIPVGDCTRFQIEIFDLPPIAQQFRGAIDLTVEVTSRELENQYDRQPLRLLADGIQEQPPALTLTMPVQQASPGERLVIAAQVHNPTRSPLEATLRLSGLPDRWFPGGIQQTLLVVPGKPQTVTFECEMPPPSQALSQVYPVALEATGRFPTVTAMGQLHLLPAGAVRFTCEPLEAAIPELLGRWLNPTQGTAVFALQFDNLSNVQPNVELTVKELRSQRRRWFWQTKQSPRSGNFTNAYSIERRRWFWQTKQSPALDPEPIPLPLKVSVGLLPSNLPIGVSTVPLQIQRRLPWLGWGRLQRFEVAAQTVETQVPLQDSPQTVQVHLFPVIPLWLQLLGALLALGLGALTWLLLTDPGHRGPVNSVQFNGQGTEVVSGSHDQTIRRWRVQNQNLRTQSRIVNLTKAVRVVRYRPVNNDQVALGFENGEIQLANLLTGRRSRLTPDKDDRVFALAFSRDAQTLYSGHGSGLILQWDLSRFLPEQTAPQRAYDVRFAITAITLSGNNYSHLAIGGRYNRLLLLATQKDTTKPTKAAQFLEIPYPSGSLNNYISSLSTAEQQPNLLAISDTQGRISVWNTDTCLANRDRCTFIEQPWLGHEGSPVRAVALSADGCFLASAGDDGDVKLWSLDGQGARRSSAATGRVLAHLGKPLKALDIVQTRDAIWVTSGGDDGQVRLYEVRFAGNNRADDRCPVLSGGGS
ncbi:hypothetical protein H6F86_03135 [Phormidium sp. FACHB-592]|uniref:WD40 repeat domain-containing protein n=1 Tax=Stenomitos frigidus AS-A4 TaxID=2933935 RepID=A0ABV0KRP9_9CYAN|nr:hypothetical protein [Phormidium sp. FACHB-592]MBD2072895.1 hypothetical protein [Phormidium sp. FACHB-592]